MFSFIPDHADKTFPSEERNLAFSGGYRYQSTSLVEKSKVYELRNESTKESGTFQVMK